MVNRIPPPFAIIGLGKMGSNLARQALEKKLRVFGNTKGAPPADLLDEGMKPIANLSDLKAAMSPPRIVLLYIPAGKAVDDLLGDLGRILEAGDIIADGGNSYWGDSVRRYEVLKEKGLHFIDLGTSGGISGARRGACFMAGGDPAPIVAIEPILRRLAVEGGYVHAGPPGAGHFVKLVHNGIEFGMLEAIGEGVDLLERYQPRLSVVNILRCWRNGSVSRTSPTDLLEEAYRAGGGVANVPPLVDDTGEEHWHVGDAPRMEVSRPEIAPSVMRLIASRDDTENWARAIAMMRHGFGGHPYGPDPAIAEERQAGRVGESPRIPR
jgi:6-phosphogluconate dehydrogenase